MAGDWIKMRTVLQTSPKVVRIASALQADRLRAVGALHAVWCLFDAHSEDGVLSGYTPEVLDELIGWPGFSGAMESVGWLEIGSDYMALPQFEAHNGRSAKRRAMEAGRKKEARMSASPSAFEADKNRTREEKRREESNPPTPLKGERADPPGFDEFWRTYPRKAGKGDARKKWRKLKPSDALQQKILGAVEKQKQSEQWRRDGGQYIPLPATWLNQERWDDDLEAGQSKRAGGGFVA